MNLSLTPENLPRGVNVIASLLIDPIGRVREGSSSRPLSSPEDRKRFLALRALADCIIVGRRTWESESYSKSKTPVVIYSRRSNPISEWDLEIKRLQGEYGPRILIEAGPDLLGQLLVKDLVDRLYLTRTSRRSNDESSPRFDLEFLTTGDSMELIERVEGEEDQFEVYQRRSLSI